MDGGADDLVARQAPQPSHSLGEEGRKLAGACSACLRPHLAQSGGFRIESKIRSLSKRDPVPLGKDPNIDADWVVVCTRVREDSPRCYVLTSGEVSKLANRDKRGPNHWLEQRDYDT